MRAQLVLAIVAAFVLFLATAQHGLPKIWELTDGEDKGVGAGFDVVQDLRQPPWIYQYTYLQNRTLSVGNKLYLIPDGVSGSTMHRAIAFNESMLTRSWQDYYTYTHKSLTISAAVSFGGVELSAAFTGTKGRINHLLANGTRSFGFNGATFITFALQFRGMGRPKLDSAFAADLASLPRQYDAHAYRRFLLAWGTHYFTRAMYGCMYNMTVSFDNKFTERRDVKWATRELDLSIKFQMFQFGMKTERTVNKSQIDGSFLEGAKALAQARGGDESKFVVGRDFDGWLQSCATMKAPLVGYSDVEPLTEAIADRTLRENVRLAILDYGQGRRSRK